MFVRNDVTVDARVLKEAATLTAAGHAITIIGTARPDGPTGVEREERDGVAIVRVPLPSWRRWWRWLRAPSRVWSMVRHRSVRARPGERMDGLDWVAMWRFGTLGWAKAAAREAGPADAYHGHDLSGLPAAVYARRANGGRLVYDSHELYIESASTAGRPAWAVDWLARHEKAWSADADALVTVNDALADDLGRRLRARRVVVVHNCPPRPADAPVDGGDRIRGVAGIPSEAPVVVYTGGFRAGRGLDRLAEAMLEPGLEAAHLAFLGFGPLREDLVALAAEPRFGGRLHVLDPVAPLDVVPWVASADVDALPIQPHNRSYELSTPNKLFEAMAAGVPVVASDFPGMRAIVAGLGDGPLGEVCEPTSAASIGAAIRRLLDLPADDRRAIGLRGHRAAVERWNWETESARLVELYSDLEAAG
jgi:glycosyltransferase involved in cell wall biosynthesis